MKTKSLARGPGAVDLLEEAVHLLRAAPASLYGFYALGTLPFVLAFLYYWADMSRGAFAREHAEGGAAAMGLLFLWMKFWQAVFANGLRSRLGGREKVAWNPRRAGLVALTQSALQPFALFAVPLACLVMLPFAWVFSFYQNLTVIGGEPGGLGESCRIAGKQASIWTGQCHRLLGLLSIFALFVWLNVVTTMAWLPSLLKTLFGFETAFTQAGWSIVLNTTYLACSFALTYLFIDPLVKAVFTLRCFYGQSIQTGDDLKSELLRMRRAASQSVAVVAAVFFCLPSSATATPIDPAAVQARSATVTISSSELDHSIAEVLKRREFAWRMPREKVADASSSHANWFTRTLRVSVGVLKDALKYCLDGVIKACRWIWETVLKLWPNSSSPESDSGFGSFRWESALQFSLLILIVGIASFLAVLVIRSWRRRRRSPGVSAEPIVALPDLNDENVAADQLPEDEWLRMAQEMMGRGDFRLALRALYLAGLAHLAAREMIAIALFKSNHDYETELVRRTRALPELQSAFSQNVALFDRVWYGRHEVSPEGLAQFRSNLEQIRAC